MSEVTVVINSPSIQADDRVMNGNLFAGVVGEDNGMSVHYRAALIGSFNIATLLRLRGELMKIMVQVEQAITDEMLSPTIEPVGIFVGVPEVACEPNCEPNCECEQKMECGEEIPNGCH